jgi:hypothetical protein
MRSNSAAGRVEAQFCRLGERNETDHCNLRSAFIQRIEPDESFQNKGRFGGKY